MHTTDAGTTPPPAADAGTTQPPATDGGMGTADPKAASTLLEPSAMLIWAVSLDGKHVLVSPTDRAQGLSLVTRGEPTQVLVPNGTTAVGSFTSDSRSIVALIGDIGTARGRVLELARADGSGLRTLTEHTSFWLLAGRWLYYTDQSDAGFYFYRIEPPDGAPELLHTHSGAYSGYQPLWATTSRDGESIAYCLTTSPPNCYLRPVGGATALQLPSLPYPAWSQTPQSFWAPDGSWLLVHPCHVVDMAGTIRKLCDAGAPVALSSDGSVLATLISTSTGTGVRLIATSDGKDVVLPVPDPVGEPADFRPWFDFDFTPDGSRLIAFIGYSSFSVPVNGGSWTTISTNHGSRFMNPAWPLANISPDSRIIADASPNGLVESIDGAPPREIHPPGGGWVQSGPLFEPAGGLGKGIFYPAWMANADGSGDWVFLGRDLHGCQWSSRTAVCSTGHDDPLAIYSLDFFAITDDAKQRVMLASNVVGYVVNDRSLYYVPNSGGLYVIDDLPRPAP